MDTDITTARLELDTEERMVRLAATLGITSFGLNQISMRPGQRGRIHRHQRQEEVYVVLAGTLSLQVEGEEHVLGVGEIARVPCQVRRQLVNRGPERLVLLALGGDGEHERGDGEAFPDWDSQEPVPPRELEMPADLPVAPAA